MPQYIFTHNDQEDCFPERYRVVDIDEDAEFLLGNENLTGTVKKVDAIDFLKELMKRNRGDKSIRTEMVDAPYWKFIELRFKPSEAEAAETSRPSVL
ncbi:MAG: hypothetical protein HQL46_07465 [Gammaproteobacteria bacterium]|nr:hypothetical protein [Gammaproteobacteria bacterium]